MYLTINYHGTVELWERKPKSCKWNTNGYSERGVVWYSDIGWHMIIKDFVPQGLRIGDPPLKINLSLAQLKRLWQKKSHETKETR